MLIKVKIWLLKPLKISNLNKSFLIALRTVPPILEPLNQHVAITVKDKMIKPYKNRKFRNSDHYIHRYPYEHSLYIKFNIDGNILIVCLCVDDLVFTGNNPRLIFELREAMISQFMMNDLGLMAYFLGIEISQLKD